MTSAIKPVDTEEYALYVRPGQATSTDNSSADTSSDRKGGWQQGCSTLSMQLFFPLSQKKGRQVTMRCSKLEFRGAVCQLCLGFMEAEVNKTVKQNLLP